MTVKCLLFSYEITNHRFASDGVIICTVCGPISPRALSFDKDWGTLTQWKPTNKPQWDQHTRNPSSQMEKTRFVYRKFCLSTSCSTCCGSLEGNEFIKNLYQLSLGRLPTSRQNVPFPLHGHVWVDGRSPKSWANGGGVGVIPYRNDRQDRIKRECW